VVKAGNAFAAAVLGSDPDHAGGQRVIFLSGDDADTQSEVGGLFESAGSSSSISEGCAREARCSSLVARSPATT
jgi:predicted dinucleotide-binding enzyme